VDGTVDTEECRKSFENPLRATIFTRYVLPTQVPRNERDGLERDDSTARETSADRPGDWQGASGRDHRTRGHLRAHRRALCTSYVERALHLCLGVWGSGRQPEQRTGGPGQARALGWDKFGAGPDRGCRGVFDERACVQLGLCRPARAQGHRCTGRGSRYCRRLGDCFAFGGPGVSAEDGVRGIRAGERRVTRGRQWQRGTH